MGATSLENESMQYWPQLTSVQQQSILNVIKSIIDPLEQFDVEQYNKEIDEAVARVEGERFHTQEEVEKMAKDW